ncbi:MAG: ABC transporter permease subunit [Clostridiales bacterium]|nr:ABC transporter permease subunit [Clostridiales bacterium]
MKSKKEKILNLILPIITVVTLILVWAVSSAVIDSEYILPSVKVTAEKFFALFTAKDFYTAFLSTLFRSLVAFVFSFSIGFILAFVSVKIKFARKVIFPIISVMRALPTIAIVLLLLFWTNSKVAPIIVTLIVVLPTSYTHIESALFALDKTVTEAGRVDGADEKQIFLMVELPQITPSVYSGVGSGISLNFKLMVAAEVISQTAYSLGYLLNTSKVYFEIAQMLALVVVSVIFGVLIETVFNFLSKKAGEWK